MANPFNKKFKANRIFSDRTECKKIIQQAVSTPQSYEEYRINVFYGAGGQGKTYLKDKYLMGDFVNEYKGSQVLKVFDGLDFENNSQTRLPIEGLLSIAKFLIEEAGIPVPAFMIGFSRHYQLTSNKRDVTTEYPYLFQIPKTVQFNTKKNFQLLYNAISSIKKASLEGLPFVGPWLNDMSNKGTNKFIEWISKTEAKEVLWDIDDLDPIELIERLPKLLGYDLYCEFKNNASKDKIPKKRIVLVFDGYETLWEHDKGGNINKDKWVRTLVTYCPGVLFLFFGRNKLRWSNLESDTELTEAIKQKLLYGLEESDAVNFLKSVPIENSEIIKHIVKNSQGSNPTNKRCLPLYLDTEVETYEYIVNRGATPTPKDFKSANKRVEPTIIGRLMKHLPQHLKTAIKPLSLANYIDHDIMSIIESEGFPVGTVSYTMLAEMSIFDKNKKRLYMQPFFKKTLVKQYKKEFPQKFVTINNKLFNYYNQKLQEKKGTPINAEVEEIIRNAAHHLKLISHQQFVSWVQLINQFFQIDSFSRIFNDLFNETIKIDTKANNNLLSKEQKALLYYQLSIKQYNSGYAIEAEESISKSMEIFKKIPSVQNAGNIVESIDYSDPIHKKIQEVYHENEAMREYYDISLELMAMLTGNHNYTSEQAIARSKELQLKAQDILNNNPEIKELVEKQLNMMFSNTKTISDPENPLIKGGEDGFLNFNEETIKYNQKSVGIFTSYLKALEHQASVLLRLNEISKCKIIYDELETYKNTMGIQLNKTTYTKFLVACGRISEAEPLLYDAYLKSKSPELKAWQAHYAQQLTLLFSTQNRYKEAIHYGREAVKLSEKFTDGGKHQLVYKHTLAGVLLKENSSNKEALALLHEVEKGYAIFYHSNPYFKGLLYGDFFTYWIGIDKLKARAYYKQSIELIEKGKGVDSKESIGFTIDLLTMVPENELNTYEKELTKIVKLFSTDLKKTTIKFGIYHYHLFKGLNLVSAYYTRLGKTHKADTLINLEKEYKRLLVNKTKIRTNELTKLTVDDSKKIIQESAKVMSHPPLNKLSINKYVLPFYADCLLYEFKFKESELAQDRYLIKRKDEIIVVDWDIKTIHNFNRNYLEINDNNALAYLKFFTDVLKSSAGTFYILEPNQLPWRKDIHIEDDLKSLIEELITPPKILKKTDKKYIICAYVLYVNEVFYCEFSVPFDSTGKGYVEMNKDEVISFSRDSQGKLTYTQHENYEDKKENAGSIELPLRVDISLK